MYCDIGRAVALLDAEQHEQAGADLAGDALVNGDAGRGDALDYGSQ